MICAYPKFKGMRIHLIHRYPNHYYMEIIITPWSLLRDETGTTQIFSDKSALTTLEHYINICITETTGAEYNIDSFNLSQIDCSVNVMLSEDYSAARYIKLIRRSIITRSKKHEILYDSSKKNYKEKNKHNFRLITDNVTFTAYDKYYQLDDIRVDYESISDSLLRLELSYNREDIAEKMQISGLEHNIDVIGDYLRLSRFYFTKFIRSHFHIGAYCSYALMKDIIEKASFRRNTKIYMLDHAKLQCGKKSYISAIKGTLKALGSGKKLHTMLCGFKELGINPTTLSTMDMLGISCIPGLYEILNIPQRSPDYERNYYV